MKAPKVTVLMPVYNGEKYLREAIESILNQTFKDFEFLIINDGSTDSSRDIVLSYNDSRIRLIDNEKNIGLTKSLNRGLELARGEYIARMDADDVSLPERLEKQVSYLEIHPKVGVLGTWMKCIDEYGKPTSTQHPPTQPYLIKWSLLFGCSIAHSSVMMRRAVLERVGGYNPEIVVAQDYGLWVRVSFETQIQIANLPEELLLLRRDVPSMVTRHHQILDKEAIEIMQRAILTTLKEEVPAEVVVGFRHGFSGLNSQHIRQISKLIRRLYQVYTKTSHLAEAKAVAQDAASRLYWLAISAKNFSLRQAIAIFIEAVKLDLYHVLRLFSSHIYRKTRRAPGRSLC